MAGLAAINEIDIKKVIALSTLRQLGVIIITLGLGSPHLSFFHLLSHAYFKAMLFICAGSLIHSIKEYQDIRTISLSERGRVKVMSILIIANFSLCGLPFISGFYSKDLILELLLLNNISWSFLLVGFLGTALTVAYSCRISYLLIGRFATGEKVNFMEDRQFFILGGIFFFTPFLSNGRILYLLPNHECLGANLSPTVNKDLYSFGADFRLPSQVNWP